MLKMILVIAALSVSAAVPALAQTSARRTVSYADLDLTTPAGRARLDRRVNAALETACGSYAGALDYEVHEIDRCRAEARAGIETRLAGLRSRNGRIALGSR